MTPSAATSEAALRQGQDTGGGTSVRELERRLQLVSAKGPPSLQDQLDWAEMLLDEGALAPARLLLQCVEIQSGPPPEAASALRTLHARAGLAPPPAAVAPVPSARGTVELALQELRGLARAVGPDLARQVARGSDQTLFSPGLHPVAVLARAAARPSPRPLAAVVEALHGWLRASASSEADTARAEALIEGLRTEVGTEIPPPGWFAAAPQPLLVELLALSVVRGFLQGAHDLLYGPLGSVRLFHAAACFDAAGLGPYLSNVGQIARRSRDVFELGEVAAEASGQAGVTAVVEAWAALLSRSLKGGALEELVDDLGDRGAGFALKVVLDRTLQRPSSQVDLAMVLRMRDAALDNLDYPLAAQAQRAVADLNPTESLELAILGAIDASGGRYRAAEQSFARCLEGDPLNEDLQARLEAARMRRFEPFLVTQGFGSPKDRQLLRLRLRAEKEAPPT